MIKKIIGFSNALIMPLAFSVSIAAEINSPNENKTPNRSHKQKALEVTSEQKNCQSISNHSTRKTWNIGKICYSTDKNNIRGQVSGVNDLWDASFLTLQNLVEFDVTSGADCISAGNSNAMTEITEGFCMASDIKTSEEDVSNISIANGLAISGMQVLQATFADGSTRSTNVPISTECILSSGSSSSNSNSEGFCLASDLSRSLQDFSNFSVANGIPVRSLQLLQVLFADTGSDPSIGGSSQCVTANGTTAATGSPGGFCLSSDLINSVAGSANFATAHNTPATDLQFLQILFVEESSKPLFQAGAGAPVGAECISLDGSIAANGNTEGFCMVSDLVNSTLSFTNIAMANGLPVSGVQFFHATFGEAGDSLPAAPGAGAPFGTECFSFDGSFATTGSGDGFCLVSDINNSSTGSANFTIANDLPVVSWEFIQRSYEEGTERNGSNQSIPVGVVISSGEALPFGPWFTSAQDLASKNSQTSYYYLSDQTSDIEIYSTPYWRVYPHFGLWLGR